VYSDGGQLGVQPSSVVIKKTTEFANYTHGTNWHYTVIQFEVVTTATDFVVAKRAALALKQFLLRPGPLGFVSEFNSALPRSYSEAMPFLQQTPALQLIQPSTFWTAMVIAATVVGCLFGISIIIALVCYMRDASESTVDPKMVNAGDVAIVHGSAVRAVVGEEQGEEASQGRVQENGQV